MMVEVTQEDREAAANLLGSAAPDGIILGRADSLSIVQAFAHHRIAAYQRGKLEGARLALEAAAKVAAWAHMVPPDGGSPSEAEKDVADNAASAIRALDPAKIVGEG